MSSQILHKVSANCTTPACIIIGQRVNTLMQADNIFVLDKGRIVQQGSHDYLANVEGIYREIVKIQQDIIEKTQAEAGEAYDPW